MNRLGRGISSRRTPRKAFRSWLHSGRPLRRYISRKAFACRANTSLWRKTNDSAVWGHYVRSTAGILACSEHHRQCYGTEFARLLVRTPISNSKLYLKECHGKYKAGLNILEQGVSVGTKLFPNSVKVSALG
jgi:hypothetical protein